MASVLNLRARSLYNSMSDASQWMWSQWQWQFVYLVPIPFLDRVEGAAKCYRAWPSATNTPSAETRKNRLGRNTRAMPLLTLSL